MREKFLFVRKFMFINMFIVSLISGLFNAQSSYSAEMTKKNLTRVNNEAAVTVRATFLNPMKTIADEELQFEVRMNTHSVDLEVYKIEELTLLVDDKGNIYKPLGWFDPGGGGHHRYGVIKFSSKGKDGSAIIGKDTKHITLLIKGIAGIDERRFKWNFPLR